MRKGILETPFEKAGVKGMKWRRGTKAWRAEVDSHMQESGQRGREREAKEQAKLKELEAAYEEKINKKDWMGAEEARLAVKRYKEEIGPDLSDSETHYEKSLEKSHEVAHETRHVGKRWISLDLGHSGGKTSGTVSVSEGGKHLKTINVNSEEEGRRVFGEEVKDAGARGSRHWKDYEIVPGTNMARKKIHAEEKKETWQVGGQHPHTAHRRKNLPQVVKDAMKFSKDKDAGVIPRPKRKTLGDVVLSAARGLRPNFHNLAYRKSPRERPRQTDKSKLMSRIAGISKTEKDFDEIREFQKEK